MGEMRCDVAFKRFCFQEEELSQYDNSAQIFNALSDVPGDVQDVEELIEVILSKS